MRVIDGRRWIGLIRAARMLGLHHNTLREQIKDGQTGFTIRTEPFGKTKLRRLIPLDEVEGVINEGRIAKR